MEIPKRGARRVTYNSKPLRSAGVLCIKDVSPPDLPEMGLSIIAKRSYKAIQALAFCTDKQFGWPKTDQSGIPSCSKGFLADTSSAPAHSSPTPSDRCTATPDPQKHISPNHDNWAV